MSALTWDATGERLYETGVNQGALYVMNGSTYGNGVAWNGLTAITETPSGAEQTPLYADNIKYLNLISAEEFGLTIEAYTYPDEFGECDGSATLTPGVKIGQQKRKTFGLAYKTLIGNDTEGSDYGYRLHIVYGIQAAPSEKAYATVNDSPEAVTFSWECTTTPVTVGTINSVEYKPTSIITIDSTGFSPEKSNNLAALEAYLYGSADKEPQLPTPAQVYELVTTGTIAGA